MSQKKKQFGIIGISAKPKKRPSNAYFKKIVVAIEKKVQQNAKFLGRDIPLNELIVDATALASKKGWGTNKKGKQVPQNFGEQLMLVNTELSEAFEEYRTNHGFNEIYFKDGKPEGIPIEIADAVIRLAHICGKFGINLVPAIRVKMAYNATRPFMHGGKKV